jgi:hypothetical protein
VSNVTVDRTPLRARITLTSFGRTGAARDTDSSVVKDLLCVKLKGVQTWNGQGCVECDSSVKLVLTEHVLRT